MAYLARQSGVFCGLLVRTKQDNPLIPPACLWGCLSEMTAIVVSLCSQPVHVLCSFMEPDTCIVQFHTCQACLWRAFPCLFLMHCLPGQGNGSDAGLLVQEERSRGGRNEHRSHLDRGRKKTASRNACWVCIDSTAALQAEAGSFLAPGTTCVLAWPDT